MWAVAALLLVLAAVDYNEEGRKALEAQDYNAAVRLFTQAVATDPTDYGAHFHLGLAESLLGKSDEAIAEYRKVLELKPGLYEAELNLGIVLLRQKRAEEAVPLLQKAVEAKPAEYRPRFMLAEALLAAAGQAAAAEREYGKALEINPKSAEAELGMAHAQAQQNRLAEAAAHFRRAAELDPGFEDALFELAALYEKNGQIPEAIAIYGQFPGNAEAEARAGELLLRSKQYGEAIAKLEPALQRDPSPANRLALATAYLLNKQLDKAIPLLEQCASAEPANYDIRMMLGRALRDVRRFPPAAGQFSEATRLRPDSREAWNELAVAFSLMEDYPRTVEALDRALQLGEQNPSVHYLRGLALDKMHDAKNALESYQKFLAGSQGTHPDQEFIARQRVRIIQKELSKR